MINDKWASIVVQNFFNSYINKEAPDLLDFFAYFLDTLHDENFIDDKTSPGYFINNSFDYIDIDKSNVKELFDAYIPTELSSIIDKTINWRNFVKVSKKIYSTKGSIDNITFWLNLISTYDLNYFEYDNIDDISILKKIGMKAIIYENTTDGNIKTFDTSIYNKIPNIMRLDNVVLKDTFSISDLSNIITSVKPIGVIFLILKFIANQEIQFNINISSRRIQLLELDLQVYPNNTDIGLVLNDFTHMDYYLYEISNLSLYDIDNTDEFMVFGYQPSIVETVAP